MTGKHKIFLGGLGALTPVILNILVVDFETVLTGQTLPTVLGYTARILILFYLGGIVAYLHKDENEPLKLFELGIAAPAVITALINAQNIQAPKKIVMEEHTALSNFFVSEAYAKPTQSAKTERDVPGFVDKFLEGLTGSAARRQYYMVVVASEKDFEAAKKRADEFNRTRPGFKAEAYESVNGWFGVRIGYNLTQQEALKLRRKAIEAGFAGDSYILNQGSEY